MDNKRIEVLLIEDNPADVQLIKEMLADVEATHSVTSTLELVHVDRLSTGLERLAAGDIDVVLLDLSLPGNQGLDTFTKVYTRASNVPIVVLTGLDDEALAVKAIRAGAQDYLVKRQLDGNLLVRIIRYSIERKRLEEALHRAYTELEQHVEERTTELRASNEALQREITERKQAELEKVELEAQLRQAQKMEAIGQLAGGVAHDFNNLLQAILGYTQLAMDGFSPEEKRYKDLEQVHKAAKRATALTRQLLAFGRRQVLQPVDLDLNQVIADLVKMLHRVIGEHIELNVIPGYDLDTVHVDPGQIEQMLVNLCINARDAMPNGGKLIIETENVLINSAYLETHPWAKPGRHILLTLTDTGDGMPPEILEHIFEPFFTTKEEGEGTGLGLSMVYGIVKQHNGYIDVYSKPRQGTTFKIYLPAVECPAETGGENIAVLPSGGLETILIAEDEEIVRDLTVRVLEQAGYAVLTVTDGEEAVNVFEANADTIALALLDVVMPKRSGREVYDRIRVIKPEVRVLFSSGYSAHIRPDFVLEGGLQLIQKPYSSDELLRKVREILDETTQ
ncbi:MAG: response regulator [Candidatus Bipolaricaulia bacterium]